MPYRTPTEATRALTESLQRALSCLTSDVLVAGGGRGGTIGTRALLLPRAPVPLRGDPPLALDVSHVYRVQESNASGDWEAVTVGYRYQLYIRGAMELRAYYWHAEEPNSIKFPHVHLSAAAGVAFRPLASAHLPTGTVNLRDILRLAIVDLGVRPLRADWDTILAGD